MKKMFTNLLMEMVCLIKTKDFSIIKSNWEDKAKNILEISKELNIGLDAIVFFDDNPVEREWVSKLPEVNVIDVPENQFFWGFFSEF